ncbi:hypothetical protein LguiA_025549 [Lonicera macranthoides]
MVLFVRASPPKGESRWLISPYRYIETKELQDELACVRWCLRGDMDEKGKQVNKLFKERHLILITNFLVNGDLNKLAISATNNLNCKRHGYLLKARKFSIHPISPRGQFRPKTTDPEDFEALIHVSSEWGVAQGLGSPNLETSRICLSIILASVLEICSSIVDGKHLIEVIAASV